MPVLQGRAFSAGGDFSFIEERMAASVQDNYQASTSRLWWQSVKVLAVLHMQQAVVAAAFPTSAPSTATSYVVTPVTTQVSSTELHSQQVCCVCTMAKSILPA
jgi:hypothetical protein